MPKIHLKQKYNMFINLINVCMYFIVITYFFLILDEQGDSDYFDRTEKNQLFLWEVLSEVNNRAKIKVDSLNNTI